MATTKQNISGLKRKPAKRPAFDVKRDSASVRVRFSPQKHDGLWYESWIVGYSFHGVRIRERCNTLRRAKARADAAATKLARGEMQALELRGEDRRMYLAAVAQLKGLRIRLDVAVREYADAKRLVKKADLRGVANYYMKHGHAKLRKR